MAWKNIIERLVKRQKLRKTCHTIRRLQTVESFNESFTIRETKIHCFKEGSSMARAAERIHQTNMEIIRLKYPQSLNR